MFWLRQALFVLGATFGMAFRVGERADMLAFWMSLPGLPLLALAVQSQIPGVDNLYWWAFPLIVALIVFTALLLVTAVRLQARLTLRDNLNRGWELKERGERIQARMVYKTENDIDRYTKLVDDWDRDVVLWLGGEHSTLVHQFRDDQGLPDEFKAEPGETAPGKFLPVHKNYLGHRITRLQEILIKMSVPHIAIPRP